MSIQKFFKSSKTKDVEKIILWVILIIWTSYFDYGNLPKIISENEVYVKIVLISFFIILLGRTLEHFILTLIYEKQEKDLYTAEEVFIRENLTKILIWLSVIIIILTLIFRSPNSILTSLGIIGAGLTIALQQPIMNIVGWATIMLGRFYSIGDRIEIDGIKGDVYGINIMQTLIRRVNENDEPTGSTASIPNHLILNKTLINYSRPSHFVWNEVSVDITYESNVAKAKQILYSCFKETVNYEEIVSKIKRYRKRFKISAFETTPEAKIRLELKDSSIQIKLRYLIPVGMKNETKTKILDRFLMKIKNEEDIEVAYPHLTIVKKH